MTIQQNDSLGGGGSIFSALQSIAVNGLSRAVDGVLAKNYPLTSFNENVTVDSDGNIVPSSAPAKSRTAASTAGTLFSNPVVIAVGVSLAATMLLFVALRSR